MLSAAFQPACRAAAEPVASRNVEPAGTSTPLATVNPTSQPVLTSSRAASSVEERTVKWRVRYVIRPGSWAIPNTAVVRSP